MPQTSGNVPFRFDTNLHPDENIRLFLDFMRKEDPFHTHILENHLDVLLPLPADSPSRTAARVTFVNALLKHLG